VTSGISGFPDDADIQPFERGETEYSRDLPPATRELVVSFAAQQF
jgi:hypothetical protein